MDLDKELKSIFKEEKEELSDILIEIQKVKDSIPNLDKVLESVRGKDGAIGPKGERGEKGEPGYTPIKNKDYFDGVNGIDGRDGNDAVVDEEQIAQKASDLAVTEVLKQLPTIDDIKNDLPKMGTQVRDSLELLQGDNRLDKSAIKDLENIIKDLQDELLVLRSRPVGGGGARMQTIIAETPTGSVNGTNDTFTLTTTPKKDSLMLIWNGQFQRPGASFEYVLTKKTITFNTGSIPTDGSLFAYYCKL